MTLYRNVNTGDVFDTTGQDPDLVADIKARPNFHQVTKEQSTIPLAAWTETIVKGKFVEVLDVMPAGLIPDDGQPGPVDVPQSGPTGSKSNGHRAPGKAKPAEPVSTALDPQVGNPDGKQVEPAPQAKKA